MTKKHFKLIFLLLFVLTNHLTLTTILAQARQYQWLATGGSSAGYGGSSGFYYGQPITQMAIDAHGNIYGICNSIAGAFTINGQTSTIGIPDGINNGYVNPTVVSYDCNGNFRWMKCVQTNRDYCTFTGISVNSDQDIVIIGLGIDTGCVVIDSVLNQIPFGTNGSYIIKLDSNGNRKQVRLFTSTINANNIPIYPLVLGDKLKQIGYKNDTITALEIMEVDYPYGPGPYVYDSVLVDTANMYRNCIVKINAKTLHVISITRIKLLTNGNNYLYDGSMDDHDNIITYGELGIASSIGLHIGNAILPIDSLHPYYQTVLKIRPNGDVPAFYALVDSTTINSSLPQLQINETYPHYVNGAYYGEYYIDKRYSFNNHHYMNTFPNYLGNSNMCDIFVKFDSNTLQPIWAFARNAKIVQYIYHLNSVNNLLTVSGFGDDMTMNSPTDSVYPTTNYNTSSSTFIARNATVAIDSNGHYVWGQGMGVSNFGNGLPFKLTSSITDSKGNIYQGGFFGNIIADNKGHTATSTSNTGNFFITKLGYNAGCNCTLSSTNPTKISQTALQLTVKGNAIGVVDSLVWFWGDGTHSSYATQNTSISHTYATAGSYTVCLHSYNACGEKDSCFSISVVTSLNPLVDVNTQLLVYPNPTNDVLHIDLPIFPSSIGAATATLYNNIGQVVYQQQLITNHSQLSTSTLPTGIYTLQISLADGRKGVRKVVKE